MLRPMSDALRLEHRSRTRIAAGALGRGAWRRCVGWAFSAAALGLSGLGCLHDPRPADDMGGSGLFNRTPEVSAPEADRCAQYGKSAARSSCEDAKYLAQVYVRRLSVGDDLCLEDAFGDVPGAACLARASISDAGLHRVLITIRDAKPESRWFKQVQSQIWFEEDALVDLYLAQHGY